MQAPLDDRLLLILDHVLARLVPADELGPGAREARVIDYVTRALEDGDGDARVTYARGLAALDHYSQRMHGAGFSTVEAEAQDAALVALEQGAIEADGDGAAFFELVLRHTRQGMFGDPRWGGNAERIGWDLLGYPGPRHVWTAEDQALTQL